MFEVGKAVLETPLALTFLQIVSATIVLFVLSIILLHLAWQIGISGLFYKKRAVAKNWNRHFYPSVLLLLLFTLFVFCYLVNYG